MSCKISGIYKIENLVNHKVYVGQSVDIHRRWQVERKLTSINSYLKRAILKYGIDNFDFSIIEVVKDKNELNDREQYWIKFYQSLSTENGYNIQVGGKSHSVYRTCEERENNIRISKNKYRKSLKGKLNRINWFKNNNDKNSVYAKNYINNNRIKVQENRKRLGQKLCWDPKSQRIISKNRMDSKLYQYRKRNNSYYKNLTCSFFYVNEDRTIKIIQSEFDRL